MPIRAKKQQSNAQGLDPRFSLRIQAPQPPMAHLYTGAVSFMTYGQYLQDYQEYTVAVRAYRADRKVETEGVKSDKADAKFDKHMEDTQGDLFSYDLSAKEVTTHNTSAGLHSVATGPWRAARARGGPRRGQTVVSKDPRPRNNASSAVAPNAGVNPASGGPTIKKARPAHKKGANVKELKAELKAVKLAAAYEQTLSKASTAAAKAGHSFVPMKDGWSLVVKGSRPKRQTHSQACRDSRPPSTPEDPVEWVCSCIDAKATVPTVRTIRRFRV